jgi:hypothetical protein
MAGADKQNGVPPLSDTMAGLNLQPSDMPTHAIQRGKVFAERLWERIGERLSKRGPHLRPFPTHQPREQVEVVAPKNELVAAYRKFAKLCSIVAILVGYHVLLGWLFEIPVLTRPWSGLAPMQMSAAVCAVLAGTALLLLQMQRPDASPRKMLLVRVLAGLTQFIAALSVLEHLFGWNFGVDQLVSRVSLEAGGNEGQAPTSITSALAFFVLGGGIMSIDLLRSQRLTEALAVISGRPRCWPLRVISMRRRRSAGRCHYMRPWSCSFWRRAFCLCGWIGG